MKRFYLADETLTNIQGQEVTNKDVLMFQFNERGNDFVGRANLDHVKNKDHADAWLEFMKANPDYVCPFDLHPGSVGNTTHSEVVAPVEVTEVVESDPEE